mgnify:CR=1 FL=1
MAQTRQTIENFERSIDLKQLKVSLETNLNEFERHVAVLQSEIAAIDKKYTCYIDNISCLIEKINDP